MPKFNFSEFITIRLYPRIEQNKPPSSLKVNDFGLTQRHPSGAGTVPGRLGISVPSSVNWAPARADRCRSAPSTPSLPIVNHLCLLRWLLITPGKFSPRSRMPRRSPGECGAGAGIKKKSGDGIVYSKGFFNSSESAVTSHPSERAAFSAAPRTAVVRKRSMKKSPSCWVRTTAVRMSQSAANPVIHI